MNAPLEVIAANLRAIRAEVNECADKLDAPRFAVSCSQCGREFVRNEPHGFSHCLSHMTGTATRLAITRAAAEIGRQMEEAK